MMFSIKYLSKFSNVSRFFYIDNRLYVFTLNKKLLAYFNFETDWETICTTQHTLLKLGSDRLLSYRNYLRVVILQRDTGEVILERDTPFTPVFVDDSNFIYGVSLKRNDLGEAIFGISGFDSSFQNIFHFDTFGYVAQIFYNGIAISANGAENLSAFQYPTGTRLWQLDLSDKGKFRDIETGEVHQQKIQLLEVHEDMVVVFMGNGYLAAYRVQDGSLVWERVLECGHTYIKIANGQVNYLYPHGLGNRFSVYDLNTGNLLFEVPISDEVFQREHFFTKPSISGNYFLITGQYRRHIFFFNRQTAVLEFKVDLNPYTHESGIGFDNAPQLHGRHLYQLNNEGQLMVFEVE